jgi:predicted transcriptional regulator of viral defense system
LWQPKYSGGLDEVVKAISIASEKLDYLTLWEHSKRLGVNVVMRRLGYIVELLGLDSTLSQETADVRFNGFMWLDPIGPRRSLGYSKRWGLMLNRSKEELTSWMGQ